MRRKERGANRGFPRENGDSPLTVRQAAEKRTQAASPAIRVPKRGLEPPRPNGHMTLNHARLPIPPLGPGAHLTRCSKRIGTGYLYPECSPNPEGACCIKCPADCQCLPGAESSCACSRIACHQARCADFPGTCSVPWGFCEIGHFRGAGRPDPVHGTAAG